MLLDDIRKKKYSLKEAPEFPEYLRKDTHDIILDFIRSRPPLNPVSLPLEDRLYPWIWPNRCTLMCASFYRQYVQTYALSNKAWYKDIKTWTF